MSYNLVFEDFYNEELISSGSFGIVHRVKNKATGEKWYAIKTMTFQSNKTPDQIEKELAIWDRLQSLKKPKAIPDYYGFKKESLGLTGLSYHMIFDYFPNSLQSLIKDLKKKKISAPFPFEKIQAFSLSLINAMSYLQSMKICHRDLKPANLLLDNDFNQIYVIDFGESKEIIQDLTLETQNEMTLVGTTKYLTPELFIALKNDQDKLKVNPFKSDVFSFGLSLLELGTLEVPKPDLDLAVWEQNIRKVIRAFKNNYVPEMKNDSDMKALLDFIKMLKKCLRIEQTERPDFIRLFCRNLRTTKEANLREHILMEDEAKTNKKQTNSNFIKILVSFWANCEEKITSCYVNRQFIGKDIKNIIQAKLKIPINEQNLFFEGEYLPDDQSLIIFQKLQNKSILQLIPKWEEKQNYFGFNLKNFGDDFLKVYDLNGLDPSRSIENVVTHIKEDMGIFRNKIVLLHEGTELETNKMWEECKTFELKSYMNFDLIIKNQIPISVKTLTGIEKKLYIEPSDRIDIIKSQIESQENIPKDHQRLFFAGKYLENNQSLGDYQVPKEYLVRLRLGFEMNTTKITINVKTRTGFSLILEVHSDDEIKDVKNRIQDREGIPPDSQHLYFNEIFLEDDKTLSDYQIENGSNLQLRFLLKGGMQIFVKKYPTNETITLDVWPWNSICLM